MNKLKTDDAAKIIFAAFALQILLSLPLLSLKGNTAVYAGYFVPQFAYIATAVVYMKAKKVSIFETVPVAKKFKPAALLFAVLVTAGLFCQNLILALGFNRLMELVGFKMSVTLPDLNSPLSVFLALVFLAAIPAIGEEIIFRGVLVSAFRHRGEVFAVLMSSLIFCLSHLNAAQLVHQFILGVVLSYITVKTGNLVWAVIIHFLNNAVALTLPLLIPAVNNLGDFSTSSVIYLLIMFFAGAAVLYPSIKGMVKYGSSTLYDREGMKFFAFFVKNNKAVCYNNQEGSSLREKSFWLTALIITLAAVLALITLLSAFPGIAE